VRVISSPRDGTAAGSWLRSGRWRAITVNWVDVAWGAFSALNLAAIIVFSNWETIPFHFIWISFTIIYGFRVWAPKPTSWVLAVVIVTTGAAIALDIRRGTEPAAELTEVPLMAAMFCAMVWHARRRLSADQERQAVSEHNSRLLGSQRRFLQDAAHQLRTPITIALGHAELLAAELTGRQRRDIQVVVGELARLRRIGERLLVIAASEDPDFLLAEPLALDRFTMEAIRRWRPSADRGWQLGRLDEVTVNADRVRLGLAVDALLENAVRHTVAGDVIRLSVSRPEAGGFAGLTVSDTGSGIPGDQLGRIFDRFSSGAGAQRSYGTGLGLALVRAVARAHGGDVRVRSAAGEGSEFELALPVTGVGPEGPPDAAGLPVGNTELVTPEEVTRGRWERPEPSRD
jgi:signal transduction histidine kinase